MIRKKFYTFLSIPVFTLLYINTAIVILLALPAAYLRMKGFLRNLRKVWAKSVFIIIGKKLIINGRENIDPAKHYILLANHGSFLDIPGIMTFLPGVSWFGHERLLKIPLFGRILKMTDYVPMRPANIRNTKEMLDQLIQKSDGFTVAIFPEGTRTVTGKFRDFKRGFIHLMRATDLDLLPVTLNGFYKTKPKTRMHLDFSQKMSITIHRPINKESLAGKEDPEILEIVRKEINSAYMEN